MREIVRENYLAQQLFRERTLLLNEKQGDWKFILEDRAAKSLQRRYRHQKAKESIQFKLSARKYKALLHGKERAARKLQSLCRRHQSLRQAWFRVNLRYEKRYDCDANVSGGKYLYFDSYTGKLFYF
mmetsp:Transcript_24858/g.37167  ORF Transcript_24858/g.37167 Transcript_24858/m.37167 type:complete len:127 (+) Transcript_24858:1523-1903(+)